MAEPVNTRITHRDMRCRGPLQHQFRCRITTGPAAPTYAALPSGPTLALPVCPSCAYLADDATSFTGMAMVPESERFAAWLALDGSYLSVPGDRNAAMPARYEGKAIRVEGYGIRDLDRFDSIRSRQTGNDVANEMNYDEITRAWRDDAPYDPDNMTSEI